MFMLGFPLLLVPFAVYNIIAFLMPGVTWTGTIATIHMTSGGECNLSVGDILVALAILLLFGEVIKSTRIGVRTIVDHALSHELVVRQRLLIGVMRAYVRHIALVVWNADHSADDACGALDRLPGGCDCLSRGHSRNPPTAAALCDVLPRRMVVSKRLKILVYSSVHESGRTKP